MKFIFDKHDVIKVPGKSSFDSLTHDELASMIEADSALSRKGNELFSPCALDEFLHNAELERPELILLRDEILENIYIDEPNTKTKRIDTEYLRELAERLRRAK